ncbi:MAG: insulinase family protein [Mangrovibacterium sp.]
MRKLVHIIALMLLVSFSAQAQIDRSIVPGPGPATKLDFGKSTKFELKNGLKVIVVENHKFPTVSYTLLFDRDPIFEGDKAGYTQLTGELMKTGTTTRTKAQIDDEIDFIAGGLSTGASSIGGNALKKHNDELLDLICDVTFNPTFPEDELEKARKQLLQGLKASKTEMTALQSNISNALLYGKNTAWGELLTEETLHNITREDLVEFHHDYIRPNGTYLIIVGDVTAKEAKKLAKKRFGKWEAKAIPTHEIPTLAKRDAPVFALANKDASTQSAISVSYPINLTYGDDDVMAVTVMNQILGGGSSGKLFMNLREDKAWTYGAYSSTVPGRYHGSFKASANVRVTATDSAFVEIQKEMLNIANDDIDATQLQLVKNKLAGSFGRGLENSSTIANYAYNIDKYNLPADYYETYMNRLESITAEDVQRVAKKYLTPNNALYLAVGDVSVTRPLIEKMAKGSPVNEYDFYANKVERTALPADLTAQTVIKKYIDAIGGEANLKAVKSLAYVAEGEIQGMNLIIENTQTNDKFCLDTKVNGNSMSKQIYDGKAAIIYAQGQRHELPEQMASEVKKQTVIFPELSLLNNTDAVLSGVDKLNGADVYVVKAGSTIYYFDQKTGLKLQTISSIMGQSSTVTYGDYKSYNGILIPTSMEQSAGAQSIELTMKSVEINGTIDASLFE